MSWSLSRVGTYEQCPLKYKFRYILRLQEGEKNKAASRGVEKHKEIEDFLSQKVQTLSSDLDFYTQFLTGIRDHGQPEIRVALNDKWEVVGWDSPDAWLKSVLDFRVAQPDLGKSTVYDWKSGKIYPDHDDQKHLYSLVEMATDQRILEVDAVHVYIDLGKTTKKTYRRDWMIEGQKKWQHRVDVMENDTQHIPNPTYLCRFCPFRREIGGPCRF